MTETREPQAAHFQQANPRPQPSSEELRERVKLPERGGQTDALLAQRVANGQATPDEVGTYRIQRAARDAEINEVRASRAEEFAGMDKAELDATEQHLQRELDKVSLEMRNVAPQSPLFKSKRQEKLNLAFALEDIKAGRDQRKYNDATADQQNRSDERKQFDAAKNMPLSSDDAAHAIDSEVPGKETPSEDEQNPNLDSRQMLKGDGVIRTIRGNEVVAQVPATSGSSAARDAVHGN